MSVAMYHDERVKFSAKQNLAYPIGVAVYMKAFLTGAKSELVTLI